MTDATPADLAWPVVYAARTLVRYGPARGFGTAWIGGPLERRFTGVRFGPAPLHRVATFELAALPAVRGAPRLGELACFYGLRYDGCRLRYRDDRADDEASEVLAIDPGASAEGWPYAGYPDALPYAPLDELGREPIEPGDFARRCTWQGLSDLAEDEIVVVVPACPHLGVSLWGRAGDLEGVQLVFRHRMSTGECRAENQCT